MSNLRKRVRLKSLSAARQELLMCMHQKQCGTIRDLAIASGEPDLRRAIITRRRNLSRAAAQKRASRNFILKPAHLNLLDSLDEIKNGKIKRITFRDGVPHEVEQNAA